MPWSSRSGGPLPERTKARRYPCTTWLSLTSGGYTSGSAPGLCCSAVTAPPRLRVDRCVRLRDRRGDQLGHLLLHLGRPRRDGEADRPDVAVVEAGRVLELQARVALAELARVLEREDDLALGV